MIRAAGIAAALCLASPALAQQDWSRLNQWQVACTPEGVCQMTNQNLVDGQIRSQVLLYRVGDAVVVEYTIPLGVDIRKGVKLVVDGRQSIPTDLLTCRTEGCVGFQVLNNRTLNMLAVGGELAVTYHSADDNREKRETFTLVGFTRSYQSFNR